MEINSTVLYIEKDDLHKLLQRAYEEGSFGYLDLRDSAVAKIVEEYIETRKAKAQGHFESYPYTGSIQIGTTATPTLQFIGSSFDNLTTDPERGAN